MRSASSDGIQKVRKVINRRLNSNVGATINQDLKYQIMGFGLYPNRNGKLLKVLCMILFSFYNDHSGMEEPLRVSKVLVMFYFLTKVLVIYVTYLFNKGEGTGQRNKKKKGKIEVLERRKN